MITQSPSFKTTFIPVLLVALAAGGAGLWISQRQAANNEWQGAIFYPQPRPIQPFELVTADGPFTEADLRGDWDLLFFGFTNCPDICPNTMAVLADVSRRLAEAGKPTPRVTLISVDPERDDLEKLAEYARFFDPGFRGATGDPAALAAMTRNIGVAFFVAAHEPGATDYAVDHSASVMIVDPEGRLVGMFRPPVDPVAIRADLERLVRG